VIFLLLLSGLTRLSTLAPSNFVLQDSVSSSVASINTYLQNIVELHDRDFLTNLWTSIDGIIDFKDCTVISFVPDLEDYHFPRL
jgi:hypothetical protein